MGERRTSKLCMQPEEDTLSMHSLDIEVLELGSPEKWLIFSHQVKRLLKGHNIGDMDGMYTLVQDLLRGNTLVVFNNT
eukprot:3681855-Ditylum_brightwellii.AAC.2